MKIVEFPEVNVRYAEHQPEYETLPVFKDPNDVNGSVISCWQLEPEELKVVNKTQKLWLHVLTFNNPLQPVLLDVINPFGSDEQVNKNLNSNKQYFITINAYQTKNKAHAELQDLVRQYDNYLIDEQRLQELLEDLKHHIIFINNKYIRCQDIQSGSSSFTDGHSSFYVEGNFHMSIVQVKRFEFSELEGVTP